MLYLDKTKVLAALPSATTENEGSLLHLFELTQLVLLNQGELTIKKKRARSKDAKNRRYIKPTSISYT